MHPDRIEPGPGQESVWDYPRPPRVEPTSKRIRVVFNGFTIADSEQALRVLETSHPPSYYIPPEDVLMEHLEPSARTSLCEWKGRATYFNVVVGERRAALAAWTYPDPLDGYRSLAGKLAFYVEPMDACFVGDERVRPQPGSFYGGWLTSDIVGPVKGAPGTAGW